MNTTNLPTNLQQFTVYQVLSLVSSNDLDASEFGTRLVRYMALTAKACKTYEERNEAINLGYLLSQNLYNPHFRVHLCKVLHLDCDKPLPLSEVR